MCELGTAHMGANENSPPRKYKRYDEAFQRSTVEHWRLSGKSARQVALELGLNVQSLQQWQQKFKALPAGQWPGRWRRCKRRTGACKRSCTGWRSSGTF